MHCVSCYQSRQFYPGYNCGIKTWCNESWCLQLLFIRILTGVRCGAEIDLMSLRLCVSQGASSGDFGLVPAHPIGVTQLVGWWVYLFKLGSETTSMLGQSLPELAIEPVKLGLRPSMVSTKLTLHPFRLFYPHVYQALDRTERCLNKILKTLTLQSRRISTFRSACQNS